MVDPFRLHAPSPLSSSRRPYPITPDDAAELPIVPIGIYVGRGGNLALVGADSDQPVTYRNLSDGAYVAVQARKVLSTGTTASDLVAEA